MLVASIRGACRGGIVQFESHRVPGRGVRLHVRRAGAGRPLLLLHGFPDSSSLWDAMAPGLVAAGYRVIAPDLRGFGESEAPGATRDYRLDLTAADAAAVLDQLCPGEAVAVVGHDWGAVVAWCLAMWYPRAVRAQVVISVGHPREYALAGFEQLRKGAYVAGWQARGLAEAWLARKGFAGLRRWAHRHPRIDEAVRLMARPGRLTAGLNWYRANLVRALFGQWPSCRVPTLGVWSSDDPFLAEDQMRRSSRRMEAAWEYARVDGAGHWLPLEQADRLNALVLEWCERHAG